MTKRARKPRLRSGTLVALTALLFGSAVLRIGVEAAPSLTRDDAAGEQGDAPAAAPRLVSGAQDSSPRLVSGAQDTDDQSLRQLADGEEPDFSQMLRAFQARDAALRRKERELQDRMRALEVTDAAVDARLATLIEAEERLRRTLARADGASEDDLSRLTDVYEKMKPKEAALLFEEMDPDFAAGFLARMNPDIAAGIMAGMSPRAAYTVSVVLAGRHVKVPKE
jgi:flagellar motility protein MotE (MotC chaperone)